MYRSIDVPRDYSFQSAAPGPRVAVIGYVHGDERSGEAIARLACAELELRCGSLLLIEANQAAREAGKRFVDADLNRLFAGAGRAGQHEAALVEPLQRTLRGIDILIDLHATSQPSPPFAAAYKDTPRTRALAMAIDVPLIVDFNDHLGGTLIEWCAQEGATSLAIECGHKSADETAEFAVFAAVTALTHCGVVDVLTARMVTYTRIQQPGYAHHRLIGSVSIRDPASFCYATGLAAFRLLPPCTVIGADGVQQYASPNRPSILLMPAAQEAIATAVGPVCFIVDADDSDHVATGDA